MGIQLSLSITKQRILRKDKLRSGRLEALLPPSPLRTVRAGFLAHGSSTLNACCSSTAKVTEYFVSVLDNDNLDGVTPSYLKCIFRPSV